MSALSWILGPDGFARGDHVPLTSRAFRYGMSLFETLAVLEGRPLFLEEHLDRLRAAAGTVGFPIPPGLQVEFRRLVASTLLPTGVLRLYLSADPGLPTEPVRTALASLQFETVEVPTRLPAPAALIRWPRAFEPAFPGLKSANYWSHIAARQYALNSGADDALLFNASGHLVGASMANVFICLDGKWQTPSLDAGARDGVVRDWLLRHHSIRQTLLTASDADRASAIFLTNSRVGIQAASALGARAFSPAERGAIAPLWQSYHDLVLHAPAR